MSLGSAISGAFGGQNGFQGAPITNQDLTNPINAAQTAQTQNLNNQNSLGQALLLRANGGGPSAAGDMLTAAQGSNAAQAAANFSGNRSINPGLAARIAAQVQGNSNQTSANQAAQLRAQQQIAATGQLQSLYGQEGQQNLQGEGIYQQAEANQNNATNGANSIAAGVSQNNANNAQAASSGLVNGVASAGAMALNKGGMVQRLASGGPVINMNPTGANDPQKQFGLNVTPGVWSGGDGLSSLGQALFQHFKNQSTPLAKPEIGDQFKTAAPTLGVNTAMPAAPMPDPYGSLNVPSANLTMPEMKSKGGSIDMRTGGGIPGKAAVKGDSPKNDTVPVMASPQEIMLPRSVTTAKDAPEEAKRFVQALIEKEKAKGAQKLAKGGQVHPAHFGAVLEAQANLHKRLKALETKRSA